MIDRDRSSIAPVIRSFRLVCVIDTRGDASIRTARVAIAAADFMKMARLVCITPRNLKGRGYGFLWKVTPIRKSTASRFEASTAFGDLKFSVAHRV
jgi:hypothetical protein